MFGGFGAYSQMDAMRQQAEAQRRLNEYIAAENLRQAQARAAKPASMFDDGKTLDLVCIDGVWQEPKALR